MKKILFLVAAMCCTMLASVYATDLSDNAVIKVGATTVTDENKGDILGDGKVSYDPTSHTLYLADKAKVEGGLSIEAKGTYGVTISVSGYASITSNSHALQYVGYNPGYPLTITGNHEANLTVRTNASPYDAVAILCAKAPTSLKDDTYTLKVNGGMRLNVANDWSGKYEAIVCNHLEFDHVTVAITAPSGEDAAKCLDDEKNSFVKTASCMYDDNEVTFYKYDKAYPVIIDGYALSYL